MNSPKILFIGYGVVGQHECEKVRKFNPDIYDPKSERHLITEKYHYDFAFICVPTPNTPEGLCDVSVVKEAISKHNADVYIIKSTVAPKTTSELILETGKHIVFSPEHYGATQHVKNFDYNFTILGGERKDCLKVQQMLQEVYDARHRFIITDSTTAEISKYMLNSYLAMKVNFCNAFWEIANQYGVDYEGLRECFIQDPRINPAHTFVYDNKPYWDSHCFNKDLPAIANATDNQLLKAIVSYNNYLKDKYKTN